MSRARNSLTFGCEFLAMLPKEFVKTDTSELLYARRLLKLYKIHDIIAEHTNKIVLEKKKKNTQIRLSATTHDDTQVTMRCDLWVRLHDFLANVTKRPEIFAIIIFYFFLIFCIFFFGGNFLQLPISLNMLLITYFSTHRRVCVYTTCDFTRRCWCCALAALSFTFFAYSNTFTAFDFCSL